MATTTEPLLHTPKAKTSPFKALYVLLFLGAIAGTISLVTIIRVTHFSSLSSETAQICYQAHDRPGCLAILSEVASTGSTNLDGAMLLQMVLQKSTPRIRDTIDLAKNVHLRINDANYQAALADCLHLMDLSMDRVMDSMVALGSRKPISHLDAHAWISAVLTNHITCLDGLNGQARPIMEPQLHDLISRARTALALVVATSPPMQQADGDQVLQPLDGDFPSWVSRSDRKLLGASPMAVKANVVVAQDGSGRYRTIGEAVASAPSNSQTRYVIYIKKGTYKEKVEIPKAKKNLMLVGDGMDSTIITGNLNVVDGSTTFNSATVAAVGDGFMAQDIWIQNTAGPQKHQAVALRVGADQSIINRCRIDAYQDTLYAHSLRQFYRDCYITGTVDYIFGDAAVVFQNSQLVARKPMSNQFNAVTAQGRSDPNSNTGTSIQNCDVIASSDLQPVQGSIKTYLGRPWKEYSRTVYMQSNIGAHIDPSGWSVWDGQFALRTLYYGEYLNHGPGAGTSKRVNWPGYHIITNAAEAMKFTVAQFIQGNVWLKGTGVTYTEGL